MVKKVKNSFKLLRSYLILVVIFFLITGSHFMFNDDSSKADITQNFEDKNIIIDSNQDEYKIPFQAYAGDFYRFKFRIKSLPEDSSKVDLSENSELNSEAYADSKIDLYINTTMGEKIKAGSFTIKGSSSYQRIDLPVGINEDSTSILLSKSDPSDTNMIFLENRDFSKLFVKNETELGKLGSVIYGDTNRKVIIDKNLPDSEKSIVRLSDKSITGELFESNSNYLAGIALSLDVKGNGGSGSYFLRLYEVNKNGDSYTVLPTSLAQYEFHSYDPKAYKSQYGEWEFPIVSFLEKDKYYFLGIDSSQADYNSRNFVSLLGGTKSNNSNSFSASNDNNSIQPLSAEIHFKIYGADFVQNNGDKVMTGSRYEDLGGGKSIYSYVSSNTNTDFLDLNSFKPGKVLYDQYQNTVLGTVEPGNSFTYKFNFTDKLNKAYLETEPIGGKYFNSLIDYSFDGINWTRLNFEQNSDLSVKINKEIIAGDGRTKQLFLRISYDPADNGKEEGLFGVKSFKLLAQLNK